MRVLSKLLLPVVLVGAPIFVAACQSNNDVGFRSSSQPRLAVWRCSGGVKLTVRNEGALLRVSDTRGVETDLPADPPGQRERYGKTGFALVFDGRTASWFASGKSPTDCKR